MKIRRKVSRGGAIKLPAKLRQVLGIKADDEIIAETALAGLLLRPAVVLPIEMYGDDRIHEFDEGEAELEKVLGRSKRPRSALAVRAACTRSARCR